MFDRFFKSKPVPAAAPASAAPAQTSAGDTATVRRIVAKLEAMPPEHARLIASAAYTLARAANADLDRRRPGRCRRRTGFRWHHHRHVPRHLRRRRTRPSRF